MNDKLFCFSDFTLENYRRYFMMASEMFHFSFFDENHISKTILLRHDLEFSVEIALKMAEIEAEIGIRSTFFIQLHSEFYNTLEKKNINQIKRIIDLGHQIGLHFDTHFWNTSNEDELNHYLQKDKKTLEMYFDTPIKTFSFHNNNDFTLSCRDEKYGGLINVYSDYFRNNFIYNADSLGFWRFERLEDVINDQNTQKVQVLIHDGMWQDEVLPPRRRVYKVINNNANYLKKLYDDHLKKIGQKNIDWNGPI